MEHCIDKSVPIITDKSIEEEKEKHDKWKKGNFMANDYIINAMIKIYAK